MARLVPVTAVAGGPVTRAAIRRCTSTDTPGWLEQRTALWPECSRDQHLAEMAAWLDDPERRIALVAPGDDGVAIGFAEASVRHEPVIGATTTPVGFLEGIHVAPGWRRRGVARRLVAAVEDWAVARGCRELVSDAAPDNAASHDFHRAAGFVETERCVLFSRRLEP
ncbi:MAG: GNAT family N-acetyltransferase [Ectothiorhodospiraceae bacterium]|nr:GNAT family N-acetyltransferase [Chromatiales bacterium]MCP5153812.1 GNAT family N-acetyltransferase [Ectothiorhodospiraceae bacterium]